MSLVCCLPDESGCICEKVKACGGIHFINSQCEPHARAGAIRSRIHEIGVKPIATVELASGNGDLSPSL
ncbi:hypothetical protein SEA_LIZZ_57 [Streptomyces phage Lizz]|nr:hypothetical protein SEA_PHTOWN_57 [Streptomyces phage PHTowN]QYW07604.1 hypothetical protein SEA_LIZZ_57 [Streptomyces phage Lizz]